MDKESMDNIDKADVDVDLNLGLTKSPPHTNVDTSLTQLVSKEKIGVASPTSSTHRREKLK